MTAAPEDRRAIADLMTGWMHRDLGAWDELRRLFHSDATIEVTWFEGSASDFIDASMHMGASDLRTKHFIASPLVQLSGRKAIAETNAIIVAENEALRIGCSIHARFYDHVECRGGDWRIERRQCVYDMGAFNFLGPIELDRAAFDRHPLPYAALGYVLEKSGFPVRRRFATKGSELEKAMKRGGEAWLAS